VGISNVIQIHELIIKRESKRGTAPLLNTPPVRGIQGMGPTPPDWMKRRINHLPPSPKGKV
jgi:hypothetical protein